MWWQAPRATAVAVTVFLGLWCAVSGGLHLVGVLLSMAVTSTVAIVGLALVCALDQLGRRRAGLLRACQVTHPVRPGQPVRGASRWAARAAASCMRVCAMPMTLMATSPTVVSFAAVTALLWVERFAERPQLRFGLAAGYLLVAAWLVLTTQAATLGIPIPLPAHRHG